MIESETHASMSLRTWLVAAVAAFALHAGALAVTVVNSHDMEDDSAVGGSAIEIGLVPMAAQAVPTELPPGPEAADSIAAPEVREQQPSEVQTVLPQEVPTESEDPDRVVALEARTEVREETPDIAVIEAPPSAASVASEAAAPPVLEAVIEAPTSVAVTLGTGRDARRVIASWHKKLVAHLDRHKRYPAKGARKGARLTAAFVLDRTGRLLSATIVKGSGDASFDAAALAMLRRSDPLPAPPSFMADMDLRFTLPVVFRSRRPIRRR